MNAITSEFKILFSTACLLFLFSTSIRAELRTVTTLEDTNDGVCDTQCSLREAIAAGIDGDTIIFARQLRGGTIQLQDTLVIEKDLVIDGPNRRRITLKGNGTFRIIYVDGPGNWKKVWLDGLIVRNGAHSLGGGIYLYGARVLYLTDCLITENQADIGGGIRVRWGALYVFNSTISDNKSFGSGGAAGIDAYRATWLDLVNSTVARNISADGPGGIKTYAEDTSSILNTTVSGNVSLGSGLGRVGGIYTDFTDNTLLQNSIFAGNIGETPDATLYVTYGHNNLIGIGEGTRFINGEAGNIVGTRKNPADPRFGPLADNGRGLPTFAPLSPSPVVDAGNTDYLMWYQVYDFPFFSTTADQRGFSRIVGNSVDIGAVEYGGAALPLTTTITGRVTTATGRGVSGAFLTVRDAGGNAVRTPISNSSGYFNVAGLPANTQFTIEIKSKRHTFQSQTLMTEETTEYTDFIAN